MKHRTHRTSLLLFSLTHLSSSLALLGTGFILHLSAQEYNFRNLSVADGLAQSQVYAIMEDRRGAIWFGTRGGGVSRFDGVEFTTFTEEDGVVNNYVRAIMEDRRGNIWIGTDGGATMYDGRRFIGFTKENGLPAGAVNAIVEDSSGAIWFGMEGQGMAIWRGGRFVPFDHPEALPSRFIRAFHLDGRGRLWIGTNNGVALLEGKEIRRYDHRDGLASNIISAITADSSGAIWFATYGGGASIFDGTRFRTIATRDGLSNNTLLSILADRDGRIWLGTAGGGANRLGGGAIKVFTETEGLCNNVITAMLQDSEGNIWFGSSGGGISRFDTERFVHFTERQGRLGNWVYAIHQERNGGIWFGTSSGGAVRYDGSIYTRFSEKDGLTAGKVKCIHEDSRGSLWFGTVGAGAYRYDGRTFHSLRKEGMRGGFINAIAEDGAGNIWLASSDAGIIRYNPRSDSGTFRYLNERTGLGTSRVYDIYPDQRGFLWGATDGAGIVKIALNQEGGPAVVARYTTEQGLSSNTVRSIAADSRGVLLFGTGGGGIIVHDGAGFRIIRKRNGISSDNIYSILIDGSNRIWLGTEKGIDRIEMDTAWRIRRMKHYGRAEGIIGVETTQNGGCIDREGNIWFGTIRGAVRYNPREERPNDVPPKTHIKGIRLFFDRIETTPYADSVNPWYPLPVGLSLPYDQNHLSFSFVGISHRNPEGVRYRWKMEGFDDAWSPLSSDKSATYSNLPPGSYTLRLLSYNEDGLSDPTPATFSFLIRPPFWSTWWFTALAVGAAAGGIGLVFRSRLNSIRRENERERIELEMTRTIVELEQKSLRLAMNPHFIFNALNSIQTFIADHNPAAARRYLSKFARLMRSILENSRVPHVTVEEERKMLERYLELERLNMNDSFAYEITVAPGLDPAEIAIPPMLIQPLVENALHHGLRNSDRERRISILFDLRGELLHCSVIDNGIGREAARKIAGEQREEGEEGKRTSSGIAVTEERLEILNRQTGLDARLVMTDLFDAEGAPAGTSAEIVVPYRNG